MEARRKGGLTRPKAYRSDIEDLMGCRQTGGRPGVTGDAGKPCVKLFSPVANPRWEGNTHLQYFAKLKCNPECELQQK